MLANYLFFIFWFLLGYIAGYLNGKKKDIKEFIDETGQTIRIEADKLFTKQIPTGRIKPISAQEAYKRSLNPNRKEALEETKKTLDNIPELVEARRLAESLREERYGS